MKVEFAPLHLLPWDKKNNGEESDLSFLTLFQQQLIHPLQQIEIIELEDGENFSLQTIEANLKADNNLLVNYHQDQGQNLNVNQYKGQLQQLIPQLNLKLFNKDNPPPNPEEIWISSENFNNIDFEKSKIDTNVQISWQKFKTGLFYRSEGNIKEVNIPEVVKAEEEKKINFFNQGNVEIKEIKRDDGNDTHFLNSVNELTITSTQNPHMIDSFNTKDNIQNLVYSSTELLKQDFQVVKEKGMTKTTIKLYPEELGEVNIHLSLDKGVLNIRIVATEQLGFNYLKDNEQELQQRLINNSFDFDQVNLEFAMDDYSGNEHKGRNEHQPFSRFNLKIEDLEVPQQISDLIRTKYNYKI
ncbi:hook-length control protein FliK [Anaerobranca californiensis DSM 14826]|uniref:Hook-length control protein FliK n=1 Tax=Anaerobranca californiensis DSM 14826 TaxID=1120989 RepID=A0A1M6KJB6_9FIRM|nr:flagellar hook-length control protein FliK [Anaerobranca californiensis]SHJ58931.1 hook-length control protein FliK [Anaerobranca californiensis DSM 14826]